MIKWNSFIGVRKMEFKCKLKVIFAERNITSKELADKIGISRAAISGLINNKSLPSFETAYLISEELGMDIREIWAKKE